ncbi:MAG: hypothetical protein GX660_20890 [Clostridiaceae bacterium]|nr:hypothetical protein [Clostridiaceae bacterium]
MNTINEICPSPDIIRKYYSMKLDKDKLSEVEEHFAHCNKCLINSDYYGEFIKQITLSSTVQKEFYKNSNADTVYVAVAEGYDNNATSEMKSKDGKYNIKLIPYLDESNKALLVVKILDENMHGSLKVDLIDNSSHALVGVQSITDEQQVCFEVDCNINLKNILISIV